jgi:hypothetical protein
MTSNVINDCLLNTNAASNKKKINNDCQYFIYG